MWNSEARPGTDSERVTKLPNPMDVICTDKSDYLKADEDCN